MAFPQVASITVTFTSAEPHLIAMPATVNDGDLLYVAYANGHGTAPTPPAGWNLLATTPNGTRLSNFYKIANGTEGGTNQSFIDGGGGDTSAQVYRITGWHGTTPPEMPAGATGNDTNPNPPSLTASWGAADNLWLAVMACAPGSVTVSAYPSSYTNGQDDGSGTFMVASARRELNTATENPGAFTANSTLWVAQTVVVRPAAPTVPTAPSNLAATALSTTSIGLTWDDNSSDETSFRVERSLTGVGGWSTAGTPAANAETFTDTGRICGTQYFYRVFAVNAVGDSTASNTDDATTTACPPSAGGGRRMGGSGAILKPPRGGR